MGIEDIEATATIDGINNNDDLEESSKSFDLRAQSDKTALIKFDVPLNVDEDTFGMLLSVGGRDNNGTRHTADWNLELNVEKKKHEVIIEKVSLAPDSVKCKRDVEFTVKIINIGEEDENGISLKIKSEDLGIDEVIGNIKINSGSDDNSYAKAINLKAPNSTEAGTYQIRISVYSKSNDRFDEKNIELKVEDCIKEEVKSESKAQLQMESLNGSAIKEEKIEQSIDDISVKQPMVKLPEKAASTSTLAKSKEASKEPSKEPKKAVQGITEFRIRPYTIFLIASVQLLFILVVAGITLVFIELQSKRHL